MGAALDQDAGGRRAVLARVEIGGAGHSPGRGRGIGVGEDHDRGVATEFEVDTDETLGRGRGHLSAGPGAAGERHHGDRRVADHRLAHGGTAQHDVEHPGGNTSASSSAIRTVEAGVSSDGLSTTVLPAAMAGAHFHTAIIRG